jgi:CHAT domain-containing protein
MRAERIMSDPQQPRAFRLQVEILGRAPSGPWRDEWAALLRARLEGEVLWARGATQEALRSLSEGERLALSSGVLCAAGELAMLQGDVRAAPFGPVETQGLDPNTSGFVTGLVRMQFLPPQSQGLSAEVLGPAREDYGRARGHFTRGRCPRTQGMLALREAYVAWHGQERTTSRKYLKAAELAEREGMERQAALARLAASVVDGDGVRLAETIDRAARNEDVGLVLAATHLVRVRAAERWFLRQDSQGALALLEAMGKAAEKSELKQAAADMFQFQSEILLMLGRSEVAIPLQQKVVALRSEHFQRVQEAASRVFGAEEIPRGFQTVLASERFSEFDARTLLMQTYGSLGLDEGNPRWLRLYKETRKELEPLLKLAEAQGSTARPDFTTTEVALAVREAMDARQGSPERAASFEAARRLAREGGSDISVIMVDAIEGDEVPEALARAQAGLAALQPVSLLAKTLRERHQPPTIHEEMATARALSNCERLVSLAERADAEAVLVTWAKELRALVHEPGGVPALESVTAYLEALVAQRQQRLPEARALLERLLASSVGLEPALRLKVTELLIEVLAAQGEAERSLLLNEALLVEQAGFQALRNGSGDSAARVFAERLALERMVALGGSLSPPELRRLEQLRARTGPVLPGFPPPTVASLRRGLQALGKTHAFLGLRPLRRAIVLWTASERDGLKVQLLKAPMRQTVRRAYELLSLLGHQLPDWEPVAAELHEQLLAPVGALPEGTTVVVMAAGVLGRIPFEALGPADGARLGESHPVIYTDRITELPGRKPAKARGGSALVVGVNGEQLHFAEDEAEAVASALRTRAVLGEAATMESLTPALASARYIHIATHGALDADNPFRSFVELGQRRRLEAWKLLQQATRAELVVLSACETGRGIESQRQNESASLGATVHSAGARWVISSRWRVDDQATADVFTRFYEELPRHGIAGSLWRARQLQEGWHPYYRDAFALSVRSVTALEAP